MTFPWTKSLQDVACSLDVRIILVRVTISSNSQWTTNFVWGRDFCKLYYFKQFLQEIMVSWLRKNLNWLSLFFFFLFLLCFCGQLYEAILRDFNKLSRLEENLHSQFSLFFPSPEWTEHLLFSSSHVCMSVGPEERFCYQCLDLYCWSNKVNERHLSVFVSYILVLRWIAQNVMCTPAMYTPVTHTGPVHDITCTDCQRSQLSRIFFTNSIIIMNPQKNCWVSFISFFLYKLSWFHRKTAV